VAQTPADTTPPVFNGPVTLTFDRDLPTLAPGAGMTDADGLARGAGSSIEDNVVAEVPFGRGIWIGGADGVNIARNRIGHTSNGGIAVTDSTINFPTPASHDIVIRDNLVRGSLGPMASGSGTQIATGAIMVAPTNNKGQFAAATPSTNISIERNRVVNSGRSGIWVNGVNGGSISDNIIDGWDRHPELPFFGVNAPTKAQLQQDFKLPLVVHNSQDVETRGNVTNSNPAADDEGGEPARD
jgi:hypothetical protein